MILLRIYYYLPVSFGLFGEYFLTSKEFPNTAESPIIQPSAASAGVSITECVRPYNNPAAIDLL